MFLWVVVAVHSLSFFFISCHYISSNSKSINFSTPPCCWAWKTYSHGSALGGVFPLEISPPSGCALFPSADSLCQWHQLLLETSWQKRERGKKKYLNSELSTSMTSDSMRLPNRIRHKQFSFPLKAFLKSIFHWRSHINTVLISSVLTVRQCVCVCVCVCVSVLYDSLLKMYQGKRPFKKSSYHFRWYYDLVVHTDKKNKSSDHKHTPGALEACARLGTQGRLLLFPSDNAALVPLQISLFNNHLFASCLLCFLLGFIQRTNSVFF